VTIRPTALGTKALFFFALVVFVYYTAPYSNLFFLLIAFASVLGLTGVLSTLRNGAGLRARLDPIEPVPAGTRARVRAEVDVGGRPRQALALSVALERGRDQVVGGASLAVDGELAGELPLLPRGVHALRSVRVESAWPLGLLRAWISVDAPGPVIVYPAPLATGDESGGGGAGDDETSLVASDGMLQPSSLREFRTGDSLKRVHWRAMARRGRPVVAEWEGGQGEGFAFVLDLRAEEADLERALSVLVTIAQRAREQKEPFTLHAQGISASFGGLRGMRPWRDLWLFLAQAQPLGANEAAPPPAGPHVPRLPRAHPSGADR
jgi:uncharacterized protein (DUF58 family)